MTIQTLIVEDDTLIGELLIDMLKLKGNYDPISWCEKYEDLKDYHLKGDLYILDHDNGKNMSGSQFLAKNHIAKEKIILTSGKDSWSHIPNFKQYHFLQKPFTMKDLYGKLSELNL
jgi:DNA-binding NtrC family response regulator